MATDFIINAESRSDLGKGASRRLRRANKVPAILFGAGQEPQPLTLDHDELIKQLDNEAFYSHVLTVKVDGKDTSAVLKDLQRHPFKPKVAHVDLQRVAADQKIHMHVPLHFMNQEDAPGVKLGGLLTHEVTEVNVSCLPQNLPEFIEVDCGNMDMGDIIHLSDLKLPKGVELIELSHGPEHDLPVAKITKPRGMEAPEEEAGAAEGEEAAEE